MKWSNIIPAVIAFLTAFLLPFIFSKRNKESAKKIKSYSQNLRGTGIDFEKIEKADERIHFIKKLPWGQKAEGIFRLKKRNIDYIFLMSQTSQYGVNYFLEYTVRNTFNLRDESLKNTRMKLKKDSLVGRETSDIIWKGDLYLSQKLNMDYELKHKWLNSSLKELKMNLRIIPEEKFGYTRIKTNFVPPSQDLISFIDSVAGHIKTGL
jgi:hypothetical protein